MNLLTPEIRAALLANMHARRDAQAQTLLSAHAATSAHTVGDVGLAWVLASKLPGRLPCGCVVVLRFVIARALGRTLRRSGLSQVPPRNRCCRA